MRRAGPPRAADASQLLGQAEAVGPAVRDEPVLGLLQSQLVVTRCVSALIDSVGDVSGRVTVIGAAPSHTGASLRYPVLELTAEMVQGIQVVARADKLVECADEWRPLIGLMLRELVASGGMKPQGGGSIQPPPDLRYFRPRK